MGTISNIRDGLVNLMTGRGTSIDRAAHGFWHHMPMGPQQIEAAYRSSWLFSKIVDLPPMDMVREWREWEAEKEDVKRIEELEASLGIIDAVLTGLVYGRLGGGIVVLGTSGDMAAQITKGEKLLYAKALSRHQVTLGDIDWNIGSPTFGEPQWFEINGASGGDRVHTSRLLVFKGERVPYLTGANLLDTFWGDSIIERVDRAVKDAHTATEGFATLIDEAKIDVFTLAGFAETLMQPGGEAMMRTRMETTATGKSTWRAIFIDEKDKWENRQITWAGMPDMIRTFLAIVAGAADIPATRLLGKAPDGMNATGEGDENNYRSMIRTRQNMILRPALDKLDAILLPMLGIDLDTPWTFSPLDSPGEKEAAEIAYSKAQAVQIYASSGLVPEPALAKGVQSMLVEDGTYPGLAEALEEMPDMPIGNAGDPDPNKLAAGGGGDPASRGASGGGVDPAPLARAANDGKPAAEGQ